MRRLRPLTLSTAVGASRDLLTELQERHGQVGEMVRTMAHSPAVLGGYLQLTRAMRRTKLDRRISERISIAAQIEIGCNVCLHAHIDAARALNIDEAEIANARRGTSSDEAIAAMVAHGLRVYRRPASISDDHIETLRHYGYSDREIADVVGVVALNVLTGTFNLTAGISEQTPHATDAAHHSTSPEPAPNMTQPMTDAR